MRILAVDDSPLMQDLLPLLLESDMVVHSAASGREALRLLNGSELAFDCLLLDIEMPEMDGIELCRHIRALPRYASTPIIMLTARTDGGDIEAAFAAGANDYILKNLSARSLNGRLRVAERLRAAPEIVRVGPQHLQAPRGTHPFGYKDSIALPSSEALVDSFSLGNYLAQLPRKDIQRSRIFGAQIHDFASLYANTTTGELTALLEQVAQGLHSASEAPRLLTSYEGSGTFICIARSSDLPSPNRMEARLSDYLNSLLPLTEPTQNISRMPAAVGAPVPPFSNKTQRVRKSLLRVRARLKARCAQHEPRDSRFRYPLETVAAQVTASSI